MDYPDFLEVVSQVWSKSFVGSPQFILSQKLKVLKVSLKYLNKQQFSNLSHRVENARDKLFTFQRLLTLSPGDEVIRSQEAQALQELTSLSKAKESFARQKSRAIWMKEGDRNTKYFHGCLRDRVNNNKIVSLELEDGTKVIRPTDIRSAAIEHFQNLFTAASTNTSIRDFGHVVDKHLSPDQSANLIRRVTDEEIRDAIFRMKPDKAPGPDGYTAGFFQKMWPVVGNDVCAAVKSFFDSRRLLKAYNCTAITLVPHQSLVTIDPSLVVTLYTR